MALDNLAAQSSELFSVRCRYEGKKNIGINDNEVGTQLYRIAQEAVTNAIRHGNATRVTLDLSVADGQGRLRVSDNGTGLPDGWETSGGMGIRIMRYRAGMIGGRIAFRRHPKRGVSVVCRFPNRGSEQ